MRRALIRSFLAAAARPGGGAFSRARPHAFRQSARRLRAACGARGDAARGAGLRRGAASGPDAEVRANGMTSCVNLVVRERFGDGPGHRLQRAWRRRAARRGLDCRSVWRRSARRTHVRARGRGVEIGLCHLRLRAARTQGRCGRGRRARRYGRAAFHLRRGSRRRARPAWLLGAGNQQAGLRDLRRFAYAITIAHNGCLHLEVEVKGRSGARRAAGGRRRRAGGGDGVARGPLRLARASTRRSARARPASLRPRWSWA